MNASAKQDETHDDQTPQAGKRRGLKEDVLFVRIDEKIKRNFEAYCSKSRNREKRVIEKLLRYFLHLEDAQQEDILGNQNITTLSELLERLQWANHAFDRKFWTWALEEYQRVETQAQRINAWGIARVARYKEAYCLLDLGMAWRNRAVREQAPDKSFEFAKTAILNALVLCHDYLDYGLHRVMLFNAACSWSLLARFEIEEQFKRRKSALGKKLKPDSDAGWSEIGTKWRGELTEREFSKRITEYGEKAMVHLKKMVTDDPVVPNDYSFLLSRWDTDLDLLFLRTDAEFSDDFRRFVVGNLEALSVRKAFQKLADVISKERRDDVHRWQMPE